MKFRIIDTKDKKFKVQRLTENFFGIGSWQTLEYELVKGTDVYEDLVFDRYEEAESHVKAEMEKIKNPKSPSKPEKFKPSVIKEFEV